MSKYDDLFDDVAAADSVFADKGALDPLAEPEEVVARDEQERQLAGVLNGVNEGYLPTTVSIYGPPGTGKTLTTRRVCREFAARTGAFEFEYVNLKECRTLFSAANEICFELTGAKKGAYEGLDGVFEAIWTALEDYPEWTVLVLDEIDHVRHDSNYEPSEFFYRLLRGEGKLKRGLNLSVFLVSNELLDIDLRLDSRVQSAMSGEEVFFPPYGVEELGAIVEPRVDRAFHSGTLSTTAFEAGVQAGAERWGDARKTLRLFRQAGEYANDQGRSEVSTECIQNCLDETEREATVEKIQRLPLRHLVVLAASVGRRNGEGDIVQPVRTSQIHERLQQPETDERFQLGERTIRQLISELETMGLVNRWTESYGRDGRSLYVETTFDPEWVLDAQAGVAANVAGNRSE